MIVFPEGLPAPTLEGYGPAMSAGLHRTEFEGGAAMHRRAYAGVPTAYEVRWVLTRAQAETLAAFVRSTREAEFWIALAVPGQAEGLRGVKARFSGRLSETPLGGNGVAITATLLARADQNDIVAETGRLLAPDGSPLLTPEGDPLYWESYT